MKRTINRIIFAGVVLAIALSCGIMGAGISNAKTTKRITMTVGQKKKCGVFGKYKKAVYKSSNKKIAMVSKKGIITAKKKGKCTITAKISKRKYKYILTVKKKKPRQDSDNPATGAPTSYISDTQPPYATQSPNTTASTAPSPGASDNPGARLNVKASILPSGKRLYTVTNNNSFQINTVKLSMMYYNFDGTPIKSGETSLKHLDSLETRYVVVSNNVENADYSKTVTNITCIVSQNDKKVRIPVAVSAKVDSSDNTVLATITNTENVKCEVKLVCLFKGNNNEILDAREVSVSLIEKETKTELIMAPYKITSYDPIEYTSYELIYYAMADVD